MPSGEAGISCVGFLECNGVSKHPREPLAGPVFASQGLFPGPPNQSNTGPQLRASSWTLPLLWPSSIFLPPPRLFPIPPLIPGSLGLQGDQELLTLLVRIWSRCLPLGCLTSQTPSLGSKVWVLGGERIGEGLGAEGHTPRRLIPKAALAQPLCRSPSDPPSSLPRSFLPSYFPFFLSLLSSFIER